ncbi:MAG: ion channel [Alcanivorax sp.]|jgi:hypothetical protein|uniref:ion channel n=1 Tax=Thalassolituus TaxID=187492 RepID=UPI0023EFFDFF|nr:ion channel [Thalassolituus oleivorans]
MAIVVVILIILLSVSMHYYVLNRLNAVIDKKKSTQQWMVLLTVVSILIVHFIEILAFSLVYWLFDIHFGVETLEEAVYLSFLSYTTLGFSDFELSDYYRLVLGAEALCGLLLIAWSASFTFIAMHRLWECDQCER